MLVDVYLDSDDDGSVRASPEAAREEDSDYEGHEERKESETTATVIPRPPRRPVLDAVQERIEELIRASRRQAALQSALVPYSGSGTNPSTFLNPAAADSSGASSSSSDNASASLLGTETAAAAALAAVEAEASSDGIISNSAVEGSYDGMSVDESEHEGVPYGQSNGSSDFGSAAAQGDWSALGSEAMQASSPPPLLPIAEIPGGVAAAGDLSHADWFRAGALAQQAFPQVNGPDMAGGGSAGFPYGGGSVAASPWPFAVTNGVHPAYPYGPAVASDGPVTGPCNDWA